MKKMIKKIMIGIIGLTLLSGVAGCGKFMDTIMGDDPKSDVAVTGDGNIVSVGGEGNTTTSTTVNPPVETEAEGTEAVE